MSYYYLYGDVATKTIKLETWGGSTKHPDMVERFNEWNDYNAVCDLLEKGRETDPPETFNGFIFQWLLYCASTRLLPFQSANLMDFAKEFYNDYINYG